MPLDIYDLHPIGIFIHYITDSCKAQPLLPLLLFEKLFIIVSHILKGFIYIIHCTYICVPRKFAAVFKILDQFRILFSSSYNSLPIRSTLRWFVSAVLDNPLSHSFTASSIPSAYTGSVALSIL